MTTIAHLSRKLFRLLSIKCTRAFRWLSPEREKYEEKITSQKSEKSGCEAPQERHQIIQKRRGRRPRTHEKAQTQEISCKETSREI